jgi:curli biogenesis system outer membrane secretion channel CsgG
MLTRRMATFLLCAAAVLPGTSAFAQETIEIQPIPRNERPVLSVADFAFTATPGKDDLEELNSIGGALFALRGGDIRERQKETFANLGRAAAGMLVDRLVNTGQFRVVERAMLDEIRREQVVNDAAPTATNFTGAGYVVTGQITKFAKSKRKKGGLLGAVAGAAGVGALAQEQTAYEVGMMVRVVDSATGEVLTSMSTEGVTIGDKKLVVGGGASALGGAVGGMFGSSASDEREKRIAESLGLAVDKLMLQFVRARENGTITP